MKISRRVTVLATALFLSLSFTGCEKTLKLQAQSSEIDAKISALNQEKRTLETQIEALRPSLPVAGSVNEAARILYSQSAGDLTIQEANLKAAKASLKETEAAVAALKKEMAAQ
jgi:chromosome segregation ATPase